MQVTTTLKMIEPLINSCVTLLSDTSDLLSKSLHIRLVASQKEEKVRALVSLLLDLTDLIKKN